MRLGSLCTGIGGLDLAVEQAFGAELAWCAEIDPAASRVLAERFPGVPNIGNFVGQDPEPVDVLCGGFPCQPVSLAGNRAGTDDDRWLFDDICTLVGRMDPRPCVLVFENVRGLLTANSGDAMGRVVHGLARLGYVGRWRVVRASDVGAPHRRDRVFIVAQPADADSRRLCGDGLRDIGRPVDEVGPAAPIARRSLGDCVAADSDGGRCEEFTERYEWQARWLAASQRHDADRRRGAPADADGVAGATRRALAGRPGTVDEPGTVERTVGLHRVDFGPYTPAVERWERILGRPAPAPVDDKRRLNPAFVEWMMGFPAGWCTDILDRRTDALRCLGNAVVPQQAMHALSLLAPQPELCGT